MSETAAAGAGGGTRRGLTALLALLALVATLSATASWKNSVTVDEFVYLPQGLAILRGGGFGFGASTAPLPSVLGALPVWFSRARLDPAALPPRASIWTLGYQFAQENPLHYQSCFAVSRAVSILVLLLVCTLSYAYARRLYGRAAGVVAAVFVGLSPNMIAHGMLVTPDIYFAAAVLGTLLAFDTFLRDPGVPSSLALGAMLGIACGCKFTGLFLFAVLPAALLAAHLVQGRAPAATEKLPSLSRAFGYLALAFGFSLAAINLVYLFDGSFARLGEFSFATPLFRSVQDWLPAHVRVPFPYHFVSGLDQQFAETGYDAYLLGTFNTTGFFSYYLVGLLVKTPLPLLLLPAAALVARPRVSAREVPYLATLLLFFALFSLAKHKNIGVRYLLFIIPLIGVWVGRLPAWAERLSARGSRLVWSALAAGVAGMLASALLTWPHYLSYFNLPSGGPARGHEYLLDSNIDWGQDLITLREYMRREGLSSVDLAYFGRTFPELYGITYQPLLGRPRQRYVVVSTNLLWGRMYFVNGKGYWPPDRDTYAYLRGLKPKARLGYSLYVFDMENPR